MRTTYWGIHCGVFFLILNYFKKHLGVDESRWGKEAPEIYEKTILYG